VGKGREHLLTLPSPHLPHTPLPSSPRPSLHKLRGVTAPPPPSPGLRPGPSPSLSVSQSVCLSRAPAPNSWLQHHAHFATLPVRPVRPVRPARPARSTEQQAPRPKHTPPNPSRVSSDKENTPPGVARGVGGRTSVRHHRPAHRPFSLAGKRARGLMSRSLPVRWRIRRQPGRAQSTAASARRTCPDDL
jgi:hypothetical protein